MSERKNTSPEHRKWAFLWFEQGAQAVVGVSHAVDLDSDDDLEEPGGMLTNRFDQIWSAFADRDGEEVEP